MIKKSLFDAALEDIQSFALIFMPINWVICIIVSLVLYFTLGSSYSFGYALGSITSYLTFGLHMKSVKAFDAKVEKPRSNAWLGMILRLFVSGFMLYLAFKDVRFNVITAFIGMIVLKFVLVAFVFIQSVIKKNKVQEASSIKHESESCDLIEEVKEDEHA